ncbi:CBM35 domain-containing protein [Streptomyces sp. NBC_00199]|uniref:CBM35 domain-containing protein n=1 Tax=Streptomyces sp. NBC_00199 TaxID=2975678 RepID=UPI002254B316|nr:CBM35 domain-containing protein [Streptomyces sp. NBC_00199]
MDRPPGQQKAVGIRDVARAADVSYQTASRVIRLPLLRLLRLGVSGAGALVLNRGAKAAFDVYAHADGYYTVHADYASAGDSTLGMDGATAVTLAATRGRATAKALRLYLPAGNNRITAAPAGGGRLTLRDLRVTGAADTRGVTSYEAEDAALAGTADVSGNTWTSGGKYVGHIGLGAADTLTFQVKAPTAGRYVMNVRYADDEVAGSGSYNTNVASRTADISVNGTTNTVMFRNSYSWSNFWDLPVPVTLKAGVNTVTFANSAKYAPDIDKATVAPLNG